MKHVPRSIMKERSALFGNCISTFDINVELLLFNKNEAEDESCFFGDVQ
jgi:hypothetical protein